MTTEPVTPETETLDPFDTATNATVAPRTYYGQVQLDAWFCVLVKGTGKVPFDAGQHKPEQRRTAISVSLMPLAEQNVKFEVRREFVAEMAEWAGKVLPSIKDCGVSNVKQLHNAWAKMQFVPAGRKYRVKDKNGAETGEEREATTYKFLAVYPDEAACREAYFADLGTEPVPVQPELPDNGNGGNGDGGQKQREIARQFIMAYAGQERCKYDVAKTREVCRTQEAITKVYDVDGPEFESIVKVAATAAGGK